MKRLRCLNGRLIHSAGELKKWTKRTINSSANRLSAMSWQRRNAKCDPYLLAQGARAGISNTGGQEAVVYVMKEGECAGTRAFVDRTPRKATLRASGEAVVYSLTPDAFESLLEKHPLIVYKVMRALFRITHSNLMRMNQESQQLSNYISKTHGRY